MSKRARIFPLMLVAGVIAMSAATAGAAEPTFVTFAVDETQFFPFTSAICGFPVYQHDTGTVTTMITTMPDGSVKAHDVVVKITTTFYSTDPAHTGTVTTRPSGPFIEIDHPDGSVGHFARPSEATVTSPKRLGRTSCDLPCGTHPSESSANGQATTSAHPPRHETSKRRPTNRFSTATSVAFPPESDSAEIPTTRSKTAHSFKNGPIK